MFSTLVFAFVCVSLLVTSVLLWGIFLRFGLRWVKATNVTTRRMIQAAFVVFSVQIVIGVLCFRIPLQEPVAAGIYFLSALAGTIGVQIVVIAKTFSLSLRSSFFAMLPTMLSSVVTVGVSETLIQPYFFQSYSAPTNSMAPTILGPHLEFVCPTCGRQAFCSTRIQHYGSSESKMICENFHISNAPLTQSEVHQGDRFIVSRFLSPARWDLVVFESPDNRSELHVKRLVGLPGESVYIEDGAVWINGIRQVPPEAIAAIQYLPLDDGTFLSKDEPAVLGMDEYFVLGDFPPETIDSRYWLMPASDRAPLSLDGSHFNGVVTHTFWPWSRRQIHR